MVSSSYIMQSGKNVSSKKSMEIENFEISDIFRSYGTCFWHGLSKLSELFSKLEFSNDFGIFTVERYMLIVLGKIAKLIL